MADKTQHFKTASRVKKSKREAWLEGVVYAAENPTGQLPHNDKGETVLPGWLAEANPYGPPFPNTIPTGGKR